MCKEIDISNINNIKIENSDKKPKSDEVKATKLSEFMYEWIESFSLPITIFVAIFCCVCRTFNVDGQSMMNTLRDQDKIFVMKWNYKPTNGDVVAIWRGQHLDKPIVKRIIATEGQTLNIDFSTGEVKVEGKVLDESYLPEPMWLQGDAEIPEVIPKGYTFVMGDNRNHSGDSRFTEIGLINNNDIVGKVSYVILPFYRFGPVK